MGEAHTGRHGEAHTGRHGEAHTGRHGVWVRHVTTDHWTVHWPAT